MPGEIDSARAGSLQDAATIKLYHAHVYFDPPTRERAGALRDRVAATFPGAVLGRWHDAPVGPHPQPMYQIAFSVELFADLAPWLMLNRDGLVILLHPETGRDVADHTAHAVWMGAVLPLRLDALRS